MQLIYPFLPSPISHLSIIHLTHFCTSLTTVLLSFLLQVLVSYWHWHGLCEEVKSSQNSFQSLPHSFPTDFWLYSCTSGQWRNYRKLDLLLLITVGQKSFGSTRWGTGHWACKKNAVRVYRSRRVINTYLEYPAICIPGTEPSKAWGSFLLPTSLSSILDIIYKWSMQFSFFFFLLSVIIKFAHEKAFLCLIHWRNCSKILHLYGNVPLGKGFHSRNADS